MAPTLPGFVEALGGGVFAVDTGLQRPRFDAAYLLVEAGRAAFIDTGTNFAVPRPLQALAALGLERDAVDYVIPTHVHLDHAGGAGLLMRELPAARMLVHQHGLRHMLDPKALYEGALAVYGAAEMTRSYGELVAVDAARAMPTHDGMVVALAGRPLRFADTPGHARYHHCIWDEATRGWFSGDTFGLSYREFDNARGPWLLPSSTPVQFDPVALGASVTRLLAARPQCMYPTHFSRVEDPQGLGDGFGVLLQGMVGLALTQPVSGDAATRHERLRQALSALYTTSLRAHGCRLGDTHVESLLAVDIELNAQGLGVWLDRKG